MERIAQVFNKLQRRGQTAFIPFSIAGYPSREASLEIFLGLAAEGGDILEFGFPFSDPVADGPVIQNASAQAIRNGMTMDKALDIVGHIRQKSEIPIIFFGYFNPIHKYGTERFVARAVECGLDGVLVVDLPWEEARWLKPITDKAHLAWIYLATPTTPTSRIAQMDQEGSGFLYYVSLTGVTGARDFLPTGLASKCEQVKGVCRLPLAVGFGVSHPDHAAALKEHVDAVVVGSAILSRLQNGNSINDLKGWLGKMKSALL
ncbi:MAG TPA: tryptophan synthase subunit alpha [Desulfomonilaceae bacterium]|nr:tryptophan synthase subunit alpha [Desulfomonilaceae bacterium]